MSSHLIDWFRSLGRSQTPEGPDGPNSRAADAGEPLIDVDELIASGPIEEHCRRAEAYFASLAYPEELLQKPFARINDAPNLLFSFSALVRGLELFPSATVLDFGAGSCWASRALSQLGCRVIALDPSPTALALGEELYRRHPPIGDTLPPRLLRFDGRRIELEDGSVDRVFCNDALHHVPNVAAAIAEIERVLAEGGIAGFAEPGPRHSHSPHSQSEMRRCGVIENDIDMTEIWRAAQAAGFVDVRLAVYQKPLYKLSLQDFEALLANGTGAEGYVRKTLDFLANERLFFLYKRGERPSDSRQADGLHAQIEVVVARATLPEGEPLVARVTVSNDGTSTWLPSTCGPGAVSLGCHLLDATGKLLDWDYLWLRHPLTPDSEGALSPGETASFEMRLPMPEPGSYILEFDLVSEQVSWFAVFGTRTAQVAVEIS